MCKLHRKYSVTLNPDLGHVELSVARLNQVQSTSNQPTRLINLSLWNQD